MRTLLLCGLVVAAIAVYSWDVALLVGPHTAGFKKLSARQKSGPSLDELLSGLPRVKFADTGRSPFLPHAAAQKPSAQTHSNSVQPATARAPHASPAAPLIKVNGCMGNQNAPIVMITLPDGSTAAAKTGDSFGDITIKKIEKNRMLVSYQKRDFWIPW